MTILKAHGLKNILVVAGEASGDIHAANLIKELKALNPNLAFYGIGGKRMASVGVNLVEEIGQLSIIGVSEIFFKLKHIHRAYKKIIKKTDEFRPDLVILVDYPGFNLALAKSLKKKGFKIVYYITPQVWAWGRSRIRLIKKYVDKALVILKFEEKLFKEYGIDATFVGHPLLDRKEDSDSEKELLQPDPKKTTIALLPGSRESEVKNMLPVMLKTAELITKQQKARFILLKSSGVKDEIYRAILVKSNLPISVIKDDTYGCLSISDFVFTSSGTATLESAIMERPMLIIYKTSLLTGILFRIFARTRFIGLVNIIAGRKIAPEILQYDATPKKLAGAILSIISSEEKRRKQIEGLKEVKLALGVPGASQRAARIIAGFLNTPAHLGSV